MPAVSEGRRSLKDVQPSTVVAHVAEFIKEM